MEKETEEMLEKDKEVFIEYMLNNAELEKLLRKWKRKRKSGESFLELITGIADRDKEQGGFILSVKSDMIPTGADNIELFLSPKYPRLDLNYVEGKDNGKYAMVFTSKERFRECNDTSGVVMFIGDLVYLLEQKQEVDGIIINLEKEEVIFGKDWLRAIICLLEKEKADTV